MYVYTLLIHLRKGLTILMIQMGLDRVLALLNQAFSSIKAAITPKDTDNLHFEKKLFFPERLLLQTVPGSLSLLMEVVEDIYTPATPSYDSCVKRDNGHALSL